jgi:hypothetical protein
VSCFGVDRVNASSNEFQGENDGFRKSIWRKDGQKEKGHGPGEEF